MFNYSSDSESDDEKKKKTSRLPAASCVGKNSETILSQELQKEIKEENIPIIKATENGPCPEVQRKIKYYYELKMRTGFDITEVMFEEDNFASRLKLIFYYIC